MTAKKNSTICSAVQFPGGRNHFLFLLRQSKQSGSQSFLNSKNVKGALNVEYKVQPADTKHLRHWENLLHSLFKLANPDTELKSERISTHTSFCVGEGKTKQLTVPTMQVALGAHAPAPAAMWIVSTAAPVLTTEQETTVQRSPKPDCKPRWVSCHRFIHHWLSEKMVRSSMRRQICSFTSLEGEVEITSEETSLERKVRCWREKWRSSYRNGDPVLKSFTLSTQHQGKPCKETAVVFLVSFN